MMGLESFIKDDGSREKIKKVFERGVRVIYQDALNQLARDSGLIESLLALDEIPGEITSDFLKTLAKKEECETEAPGEEKGVEKFRIIKNYDTWDPVTPESFLSYFLSRFRAISQMLWKRPQLKNTVSISQLPKIKQNENVSLIGMIRDIRESNDGRRFVTLEDLSGSTTVLVPTTVEGRGELVPDEVIGINGQAGRGIFFADVVLFPEIMPAIWPAGNRPYAVFISDVHVGSKKFVEGIWDNFVSWIKEHREVKYVFIAGDIVDGVGMYNGQEHSLEIDTVEGQVEAFAKYLQALRSDLKIFVISGNHDPNRDSEPQPAFPDDIAKPMKKICGLELYSNPAWLEVEGVSILMYHGTSFDGLIDAIDPIKSLAYHQPYLAQIQLLRKRHLSPIFGRNKIFPDKEDFLVVNQVPNVFHTGHIHRSGLSSYKGVKLVSSGTFQNITDFQEKLGHEPTPGQFILMNLSDGASRILDFSKIQ